MTSFAILGDPALNRVQLFARAAHEAGAGVAVLSYADILAGSAPGWPQSLAGHLLRLESPGRDFAIELALLRRGARIGVEPRFSAWPEAQLAELTRDAGLLFAGRQWYLGWRDLLHEIATTTVAKDSRATFLNHPVEITETFDKPACHARLLTAGVPVPPALPPPASFDDLVASLSTAGWSRAFLKPAHGSGAGGVVALAGDGRGRWLATTAVELAGPADAPRLYATRRLRTYRDLVQIRRLVDALCRERLHVEAWVPKAGLAGRTFDVRVVVIGGHARHLVLRLARGPITNLHLDAEKGPESLLAERAGPAAVASLRHVAERAAACYPRSLTLGVDLALTPDFRDARVLEVNAFGDLLEGVQWQGLDTYACTVRAALTAALAAGQPSGIRSSTPSP